MAASELSDPDWFDDEPPSIIEAWKEMQKDDGHPFGEFEIPRKTRRFVAEKGDIILVPNHVTYDKIEGRDLDESDSGSDPPEDELDFMKEEDPEEQVRQGDKLAAMIKRLIDIDGTLINRKGTYKSQTEAADYTPVTIHGRPAEIECRVLFDYHSGYTFLDLDVLGGQKVAVLAEEHETYLLGKETDVEWKQKQLPCGYLRGQRYSLIRHLDSFLTSPLGLVPSNYLVSEQFYLAHPGIFIEPSWYLGICSYDQAFTYLTGSQYARDSAGHFVIFSPRWLNLDPEEPRPFILLMLAEKSPETRKMMSRMAEASWNSFERRMDQLVEHAARTDIAVVEKMKGKELPVKYGDEEDPDDWELDAKGRTAKRSEETASNVSTTFDLSRRTTSVGVSSAGTTTTGWGKTGRAGRWKRPKKGRRRRWRRREAKGVHTIQMREDRARWKTTMIRQAAENLEEAGVREDQVRRNRAKRKNVEETRNMDTRYSTHLTRKRRAGRQPTRDPEVTSKEQPDAMNEEPELEDMMRLAALPYAVVPLTIKRSYLGDFELFGRRYPTLYHLVLNLSQNQSELPHRLLLMRQGAAGPPNFHVVPMEAPMTSHKRSPAALPMRCEQWAASHFVKETEPFYHTSLVNYVVRSFIHPLKAFWKRLGRPELLPKKSQNRRIVEKGGQISADEHMLQFDPRIVMDKERIGHAEMILLGSGNFGKVYKTWIKTERDGEEQQQQQVVIKEFRVQPTAPEKQLAFVQEIEAASAVRHVNIANFYGVATKTFTNESFLGDEPFPQAAPGEDGVAGSVMLVFEFCEGKSLDRFLKETDDGGGGGDAKADAPAERQPIQRLIDFLSQIARALAYLHSRSPAIVHGDVAARNVMVTRHLRDRGRYVLKLIDFGLARFCPTDMTTHYDNQSIPAPWLPLETLKHGELNVTTDVWSYGCVVWEMFGGTPWGNPSPLVQGIGQIGQYLGRPEHCPAFLYNLMLLCHRPQPHDRISMEGAEEYLLRHWIENEGPYLTEVFKQGVN